MLPLDNWGTPWALRRETMALVARVMRGDMPAQLSARLAELAPPDDAEPEADTSGPVAVLPLKGVITPEPSFISMLFGGTPLRGFRAQLAQAVAADEVKSILLDVDSPGGSTGLLTEAAADIREARKVKPVVAVANPLAASAAYWLASQADELIATPSGEVGSVGVFAVHEDWSGFNEQMGIDPTYVSAGKYKTELNPDEPLSEDAQAELQKTVDFYYSMFAGDVAKGRGIRVETVKASYGEGRVLNAPDALKAGMVDKVEPIEQAAARAIRGRTSRRSRNATSPELQRAMALAEENDPVVDKPEPKVELTEEDRARIAAVVGGKPIHVLGGRTE